MVVSKRTRVVLASTLLVGLGAVFARNVLAGPPNRPRAADVAAARRTEEPAGGADERAPLPGAGAVAGSGIVEPADRESKVGGQVPGRIARVLVKEGAVVAVGDPLVLLESASERAALAAAEADVVVARATLARTARGLRVEDVDATTAEADAADARAELSSGTLARTEQLARGGAATPDELDRARHQAAVDRESARAARARRDAALRGGRAEDVVVAKAQLDAAVARRDQARAAVERLAIRAPIGGEVLQVKFRAGEYYNPGGEAVVVLGDTRAIRVRVDVDERDVAKAKVGARGWVVASAYPGRRFEGRVVEVGRRMGRKNVRTDDPTERIDTKILEVVLELDHHDGLFPGLRVTGTIEGA